jgi:hypothetical protein
MSIQKVISTQEFTFAPATTQPRKISLTEDNKVIDATGSVGRWQLLQGSMPWIIFYSPTNDFVARMQWNGRNFQGMDTQGPAELRPSRPDEFQKLFTFNRSVQLHGETSQQAAPTTRLDLNYPIEPLADKATTAVVLIACNRLAYFKEVVDALAPQVQDKPVYLFLDKPLEEGQSALMDQHAEYAKAKFNSLRVIKRTVNWGCGANIIDARDKIFNVLGHEKAFIFEDDMVPDENYIEYCEKLWDWSQQFTNVGAVQGWAHCLLNQTQKKRANKEVFVTFQNAWGYLMSRECWQSIRPMMLDYFSYIKEVIYANRDNLRISRFMRQYKDRPFEAFGANPVTLDQLAQNHEREFLENCPTCQDGMTYLAMRNVGLVRLAPTVNRAIYIGKSGIHSTPAMYNKSRLGEVVHSNITVPDSFKLRNK